MTGRVGQIAAIAVILGMIAIGADNWRQPPRRPANGQHVTLLYVGAEDCAPCRSWSRGAGAAFRASPQFSSVSYREVESPTVFELLQDQYWPEDLREYRASLDRSAGVPLWLVIADQQIVERAFGESQWGRAVLPKLKSLLQ
jgi:hypothetical protein